MQTEQDVFVRTATHVLHNRSLLEGRCRNASIPLVCVDCLTDLTRTIIQGGMGGYLKEN